MLDVGLLIHSPIQLKQHTTSHSTGSKTLTVRKPAFRYAHRRPAGLPLTPAGN